MTYVVYIFKKFFPLFIGSLFFFSFVIILIDLLINIWNYISSDIPFFKVMQVELFYFAKAVSFSVPMSVLFASSYSLSDLYAKNELTSIFASGVSLFRFTLPLLIFSLILSVGFLFFEDKVVVPNYAKKTKLQDSLLNINTNQNNDKIVLRGNGGKRIYKVNFYDDNQKRIHGITIIQRDENNILDYVLIADSALWLNDSWEFYGIKTYKVDDGVLKIIPNQNYDYIEEGPDTFKRNVVSVESVNIKDAKEYINHLKRIGLNYNKELGDYYKKFSFPFVIFIVVFLSVGLSGKTRKNVLLMSFVFSLAAAVSFYVLQMVTMLLSEFGYISPLMGAWFPVVIFIIISIVLVYYTRT
ncbi:MAG: LptF/LptG family permease [Treponemataceae bacterium]